MLMVRRYQLVETDELDEALEIAARIPAARLGGAIEVRPLRATVPMHARELLGAAVPMP